MMKIYHWWLGAAGVPTSEGCCLKGDAKRKTSKNWSKLGRLRDSLDTTPTMSNDVLRSLVCHGAISLQFARIPALYAGNHLAAWAHAKVPMVAMIGETLDNAAARRRTLLRLFGFSCQVVESPMSTYLH